MRLCPYPIAIMKGEMKIIIHDKFSTLNEKESCAFLYF